MAPSREMISNHPEHGAMVREVAGTLFPAKPLRDTSWWHQHRGHRACHKASGHWWHPDGPMIAWFCCQCGAERDGMPVTRTRA